MEGEGSRQAAPDGGSGGEEGSHTHCVVAVMGTRDFWLKDFCGAPKNWVQLCPPPLHLLGFAYWELLGCQLPLWLPKTTKFFMHALPYTKRSCGIDICYIEVLRAEIKCWPRQGSHFPKQKIAGEYPNCLFQPNPNILLSPCWSSTLLGCTACRHPLAAESSDRTRMYFKKNIHRKRDKAGEKLGETSKLVDKQANKRNTSTYVSWQYGHSVSPELCVHLKAFDYWVFWNLNFRWWKKIGH